MKTISVFHVVLYNFCMHLNYITIMLIMSVNNYNLRVIRVGRRDGRRDIEKFLRYNTLLRMIKLPKNVAVRRCDNFVAIMALHTLKYIAKTYFWYINKNLF